MSYDNHDENIKEIITFGSPVKGYSPFLQGEAVLMSNLDNVVDDAVTAYGFATIATFCTVAGLIVYTNNANDIKRARAYTREPYKIIEKVLGSSENDCVILESDQTMNPTLLGATYIGLDGEYSTTVDASHFDELSHPDIWGTDVTGHDYGVHTDTFEFGFQSIINDWSVIEYNTLGRVVK